MMPPFTVEAEIHFSCRGRGGRRVLAAGPEATCHRPAGRLPRITRLMALAIHFDALIQQGTVADYAALARRGRVTRARITQIMNLLLLAPDIQEAILFLPRITTGHDPIHLRQLQSISQVPDWGKQRRLWPQLQRDATDSL